MPHKQKSARWYFGGLSSSAAAWFTHPLDLIKVLLQTQQTEQLTLLGMTRKVYRTEGFLGFYNGLSATLLRKITYTTTRFAIYETGKTSDYFKTDSFAGKIRLAALAGLIGGFVGIPSDVVNVRMQNDVKLPLEKRRNYGHVFDGLYTIVQEEGIQGCFKGATVGVLRGIVVTVGTIAVYDQVRQILMNTSLFEDTPSLHFTTSVVTALVGTTVTQPLDVVKTRIMNSHPNEFNGILHVVRYTATLGPLAFFKGYIPAFVRVCPHTIVMFMLYEQLRLRFGIPDASEEDDHAALRIKLVNLEKEKNSIVNQIENDEKSKPDSDSTLNNYDAVK